VIYTLLVDHVEVSRGEIANDSLMLRLLLRESVLVSSESVLVDLQVLLLRLAEERGVGDCKGVEGSCMFCIVSSVPSSQRREGERNVRSDRSLVVLASSEAEVDRTVSTSRVLASSSDCIESSRVS
jgi:hypothetical protein